MLKRTKFFYDAGADNGGGNTLRSKEEIDRINEANKRFGNDLVPYEKPEDIEAAAKAAETDKGGEDKGEQQTGEEEEKTGEEDQPNKIKIAAKKIETDKGVDDDQEEEQEIADDVLLKALSKKAGREIKSLDEFTAPKKDLTPEEVEAKAAERESAKLQFALTTKKITTKEIESFIEDTKNPQNVAYNFYHAAQKEIDDTLTDEQIQESFEERYSVNADTTSAEYKLGQKEISFIADTLIKKRHAKYLNLEDQFTQHEDSEKYTQEYNQSIIAKTPAYKKDVEQVAAKLTTMTIAGYEIELEPELINSYKEKLLTPEHAERLIDKGYTIDDLEQAIRNSVLTENYEQIVNSILVEDRRKTQAGLRGVVPNRETSRMEHFSDEQKKKVKELESRLN